MSHTHLLALGEAGVTGANGYGEAGRVFQVAATCPVKTAHELSGVGSLAEEVLSVGSKGPGTFCGAEK